MEINSIKTNNIKTVSQKAQQNTSNLDFIIDGPKRSIAIILSRNRNYYQ